MDAMRIAVLAGLGALMVAGAAQAQLRIEVGPACAYGQTEGGLVVLQGDPVACSLAVAPSLSTATIVDFETRPFPSAGNVAVLDAGDVPASNPVGILPFPSRPAPGYARAWDDGRINPFRGVPQAVSGNAVVGVAP
jgi:hypothetical protein